MIFVYLLFIQNMEGQTLLHWASVRPCEELTRYIRDGLTIEEFVCVMKLQTTISDKTPLHWSAGWSDSACLVLLQQLISIYKLHPRGN